MNEPHVKTLFTFALLLGICTSACSSAGTSQETVAPPTATTGATTTAVPSSTASAPDTASPTVAFSLNSACWPVEVLQEDQGLSGSLLFNRQKTTFVWDLKSLRVRPIPSADATVLADGHSLLGFDLGEPILTLITPTSIKPFTIPEDAYGGGQDLAEGKILYRVDVMKLLGSYQEGIGMYDKFYIIDPFTGEVTPHSVFLPGFWQDPLDKFKVLHIQYSPDLHYVIYRTMQDDNGQKRFTLLDVSTGQIMWTGPSVDSNMLADPYSMPEWMPGSTSLIYDWTNDQNGENYYLISRDGKVTKYTGFTNAELEGINSALLTAPPSWSPNGRYMVFAGKQVDQNDRFNNYHLYVWDSLTKVAYTPCLPNEVNLIPPYRLVWSFDGNHFAMQLEYLKGTPQPEGSSSAYAYSSIFVLDLLNKTIFELPDPNHRGEYTSQYGNTNYGLTGWVDWQVP